MDNNQNREIQSAYKKAAPYLNIGYTLIGGILFFGFAGYWVDRKCGMEPLFMLIGLFLGLGLGFYNMYKIIKNMERK